MFVDRVQIEFLAGRGGDGCVAFRRERYVPRGGPSGGDGGDGGSVVLVAQAGVDSLSAVAHRKIWKAAHGGNGEGSKRNGKRGASVEILVPPGTIVMDAKEGFVIRDLVTEGEQFVVARGGRGGRGNARFRSATNRTPRDFTPGREGEKRIVVLELKVIADVGLVGKPNAGKSTLLSRLSHARPEIADYPFTTKYPNLGLVTMDLDHSFVMADIPGLIEGAHTGVGLGHEFLKHVERTRVLVHLIEPAPLDETDAAENYLAIRKELVQYSQSLTERPEIVAVTKAELPGAEQARDELAERLEQPVLLISAVTGQGLNELIGRIRRTLDDDAATRSP